MRWLERLRSRATAHRPVRIEAIEPGDELVELEGRIEALSVLHDPIEGREAVAMVYRATKPGFNSRYFGMQGTEGVFGGQQATDFILRDETGAAMIEIERGGDVARLHAQLRQDVGVGLEATVEVLAPGDTIRVRGRVRQLVPSPSPHRREAWTVVVVADDIEGLGERPAPS